MNKSMDLAKKNLKNHKKCGFTLIEVLIVVAILGLILMLFFLTNFRQLSKGRDGHRKADLEKIRVAFEDYYNDNECYPDTNVLVDCDGDSFRPYLELIACDPLTGEPYVYIPNDDPCSGYKVLVKLENRDDPNIEGVGCDPEVGCGYEDPDYNFGISQGTTMPGSGEFPIDPDYEGETPDYNDDYYCAPEVAPNPGCTYMAAHNAGLRNCPKVYDGATGLADCQADCNSSNACDPIE